MTATLASPSGAGPYPNLQELIDRAGGFDRITPAMWTDFDRAVARWWARYREGLPITDPSRHKTKGRP